MIKTTTNRLKLYVVIGSENNIHGIYKYRYQAEDLVKRHNSFDLKIVMLKKVSNDYQDMKYKEHKEV